MAPEKPIRAARRQEILGLALDCVHCGLCLPACPTYLETGRETSSPRGRVYLMRAFAEGRVPASGVLAEEAHLCLDCRACETACPSGVSYGALVELVRAELREAGARRDLASRLEVLALRQVVARPARLRAAVSALGWLQRSGLEARLVRVLPRSLAERLRRAPRVPEARERRPLPREVPAEGPRRGRVAYFRGCVLPELFGRVGRATVALLARQGFEVVVPPAQACCGALHVHAGDEGFARELLGRNAAAFAGGADAVVVDSAGCGAMLREAPRLLGTAGEELARRVRDPLELLDEVGLRRLPGRFGARVAYDDPCHLVHAQKVRDAPRRLLAAVPGLELVPHRDPAACCGAAGTYAFTHPEMSDRVLAKKLDALLEAEPEVVATGNPGCLMQLERGFRERGRPIRVLHPVEILAAASVPASGPAER